MIFVKGQKNKAHGLICTLFTGQSKCPVRRVIFMRYSKEFILECVDLYRSGKWPETPEGIKDPQNFHKMIRRWSRREEALGLEAFCNKNKLRTPEEKFALVSRVIAGEPIQYVSLEQGMNPGTLYKWVQDYKTHGYNGLVKTKGRPSKDHSMKKNTNPRPLTESELEELIRLRAENEYLKAENEIIKKRIALRQEKWAAQLKAKKQQSSKTSEKKDSN